jgi:hypothetical protein
LAEIAHRTDVTSPTDEDHECEGDAPGMNPVWHSALREWLGPMFATEFVGSAKILASVSLPVGTQGENIYYRVANQADRALVLRLLPRRGSLLLAVARRTEVPTAER